MSPRRWIPIALSLAACSPEEPVAVVAADAGPRVDARIDVPAPLDVPSSMSPRSTARSRPRTAAPR